MIMKLHQCFENLGFKTEQYWYEQNNCWYTTLQITHGEIQQEQAELVFDSIIKGFFLAYPQTHKQYKIDKKNLKITEIEYRF